MILTVAAVAAVAVGAKAQTLYAQTGDPIAISSLTDANAQGGVTYQWYRNNVLIPGCNEATCTLAANLATGTNVKFQRRAIALGCAVGNTSNSNVVTITFCNLVTNGVCWADVNVNGWRTFASEADINTAFYQFNRTKAWPTDGSVTDWVTTYPDTGSWHVDSSPCPDGWRLPTMTEFSELSNNSIPSGGTWAAANSKGNSIAGKIFGNRSAECTLPDNMVGCIFFPAVGHRLNTNGSIANRSANMYYWSSTQIDNNTSYEMNAISSASYPASIRDKAYGNTIRCVR